MILYGKDRETVTKHTHSNLPATHMGYSERLRHNINNNQKLHRDDLDTISFYFFLICYWQIFDATTNKWKLIDQKEHTDVFERIVENPIEEEQLMYRKNIYDETDILNSSERNTLNEKYSEKNVRTEDKVDYIRSDHLIDESTRKSKKVITAGHKEQCICEMCTCGYTYIFFPFFKLEHKKLTNSSDFFSRHRCPHDNSENLKIEGDLYIPEKETFTMVERSVPVKPHDNLSMEGSFEGRRSEDYKFQKTEKMKVIRHEDNLKVSEGKFFSQTTSQMDYQREIVEDQPIRRNTYTKEEESETNETRIRKRTWTKEELEEIRLKVQEGEKPKYKPIERSTQIKPTDNLKSEGDFYTPEKSTFTPADKRTQVSFSFFYRHSLIQFLFDSCS